MTRNERQLKALEQEQSRYAEEIKAIWKVAEDADRETSTEERGEVEERLKAIEVCKQQIAEVKASIEVEAKVQEASKALGRADNALEFRDSVTLGEPVLHFKSLGEQFVESEGFKSAASNGFQGKWTTGVIDLMMKGTLLEGSSSPGSGTGGGLLTVPQVVPGVVNKLFQRLTVMDLLPTGTVSSNTVRHVVEGTATSGAAGVAEGGAKPQSTLALSTVDEPVKKIATSLVVADEMLEDAAQVASYINGRLSLFVDIEVERQLLRGAGTNELVGIMGSARAINGYSGGTVDNKAVQIFKALNGTRGSSLLDPDAIIIHPTDWQAVRLLTDTAGQFFGGGPFQGPYGSGQNFQASGQHTGGDYLWNLPVVVTTAVGNAGTALVGSFSQASQFWTKGGVTVEATNSHSDYFLSDLTTIRAERRGALSVYRPSAFTYVVLG